MTPETVATTRSASGSSPTPSVEQAADHRSTVQWLTESLMDRLGPSALRCADEEVRHLDRNEVVRVSAFDVRTAARCQARAAAPAAPFEPALHTATRAIALRAGRRVRRFPTVLEAVADTVKQLRRRRIGDSPFDPDEWLILYLQSQPIDVRARLVARATTWLTATLELVGGAGGLDPFGRAGGLDHRAIRGWQWEPRAAWSYPGRGLRLETKLDLALPEPGNFMPVMVVAGAHPSALDLVAYSTILWIINRRRIPDRVLMVAQTEQSARVLEPTGLFERGLEAATRAVEAVSLRPSSITGHEALADAATTSGNRSFPLNLAVSASFLLCVDCSWRTGCPNTHPDIDTAENHSTPIERPSSATGAITVRGGVRMPNRDRRPG
jgi:hypothetical protein